MPLLLDLSHTSHTRARTGVQRVARALYRELGPRAVPICFDPYEAAWRGLEPFEVNNLAAADPSAGRGAHWPFAARLKGRLRRLTSRPGPSTDVAGEPSGVLVPEIFSPLVGAALPKILSTASGPRVALFHDAIVLQYPELSPRATVARFPAYLRELLQFDGVAAVSESSRAALLDYWKWLGVPSMPEVAAIPLGIDPPPASKETARSAAIPTVLCVGSIEGRKNQAALLDACESLWSGGARFELRLIGLANKETGGATLERIRQLSSAGRPVRYEGPADDAALEEAYRDCDFTVYPSIAEGFGLPVAESLARGRACLCRMEGALGEVARGGGCVDLGRASPAEIAAAMGLLLGSPAKVAALESEARARRFKTWAVYADELLGWMGTLRRNP
jgi:glycosyltransferase involved in cell wall biosynthesis